MTKHLLNFTADNVISLNRNRWHQGHMFPTSDVRDKSSLTSFFLKQIYKWACKHKLVHVFATSDTESIIHRNTIEFLKYTYRNDRIHGSNFVVTKTWTSDTCERFKIDQPYYLLLYGVNIINNSLQKNMWHPKLISRHKKTTPKSQTYCQNQVRTLLCMRMVCCTPSIAQTNNNNLDIFLAIV